MRARRREFHFNSKRLFTWLMVASVAAVLFLPTSFSDGLGHLFSTLVSPFNFSGRSLSLAAVGKLRPDQPQTVPAEAYRRLQVQLINLKQEFNELAEFTSRVQRLRQGFGMARAKLIDARVVGADTITWRRVNKVVVTRKLDQGGLHQINPDQIALAFIPGQDDAAADSYAWCVVGKILSSGVATANLQLACDTEFSLGVFVEPAPHREENWRAEGVLYGDGSDGMVCVVSKSDNPIRLGDAVVACSDPATLPIATLIGHVRQCRPDEKNPLRLKIAVAPAVDLNELNRVLIVNTD